MTIVPIKVKACKSRYMSTNNEKSNRRTIGISFHSQQIVVWNTTSKSFANRMSKVMPEVILESQTAYIIILKKIGAVRVLL